MNNNSLTQPNSQQQLSKSIYLQPYLSQSNNNFNNESICVSSRHSILSDQQKNSLSNNNSEVSNRNLINSPHLVALRRTNLINIMSAKQCWQRTERENKIIMQILRYEPFFQSITNNYKFLNDISSKIQYKYFKQNQSIYRINEFSEGYYILIRGSVELSIPQKIINNTKIKVESENDILLRQIEEKHQMKDCRKNRTSKKDKLQQYQASQQKTQSKQSKQSTEVKPNDNVQTSKVNCNDNSQMSQIEPQSSNSKLKGANVPIKHFRTQSPGSENQKRQNSGSKEKKPLQKTPKSKIPTSKRLQSQKIQKQKPNQSKSKQKIHYQESFWSPTQFKYEEEEEQDKENLSEISSVLSEEKNQEIAQGAPQYSEKIVKIVQEGECFGQITVGQINKRATNAKARYDCHLLLIKKQHYDLISRASISTQMKKRHQFLLNLELFKKVYRYSVQGFLYYLTEVPCQYKTELFKEGEEIKYVFIIKGGEFNITKTITNQVRKKNEIITSEQTNAFSILRRHKPLWREGLFKTVFTGQIIGDCQVLLKKEVYTQSCKCTSQSGSFYKIEKNLFLQKLLASQNDIVSIKRYLTTKYKTKHKNIDNFVQKQLKNEVISRILPASKSCDNSLRKKIYSKKSSLNHMKDNKLLDSTINFQNTKNNFFDQFNRTFHKKKSNKRLTTRHVANIKSESQIFDERRCKTSMTFSSPAKNPIEKTRVPSEKSIKGPLIQVPSCIKDIVQVVDCKQKYFRTRVKSQKTPSNFKFEAPKLPRFIEQKYKHLMASIKGK